MCDENTLGLLAWLNHLICHVSESTAMNFHIACSKVTVPTHCTQKPVKWVRDDNH